MTHYANDYFDLAADRANASPSPWSGGSRVLPLGELSPRVALVAAIVLGAIALGLDVFVGCRVSHGPAVLPLLLLALALSWEYSAPPLRLHSRGLGAPTVALVVTTLTPLVGYFLQDAGPILPPFLVALPLGFAQLAMILVIDFPDAEGDRAVGKKTLAVRLGGRPTAWLCAAAVSATYVALPALAAAGLPLRSVVAVAATAPLAGLLVLSLARGDWARSGRWARLSWVSVGWFALLAAGELASSVSLAAERK